MAIGVTDNPRTIEYSIPLHLDDPKWVAEHLRTLADKIEQSGKLVLSIGVLAEMQNTDYLPVVVVTQKK